MRTVRIAKNNYLHHCYLHNKDMLDIRMKKFYCEKTIFVHVFNMGMLVKGPVLLELLPLTPRTVCIPLNSSYSLHTHIFDTLFA